MIQFSCNAHLKDCRKKLISLAATGWRKYMRRLAVLICICLTVTMTFIPIQAKAGWSDDGITAIKKNVSDIISTITDARETINDQKLKKMIADIRVMLQIAVSTQQDGVSSFIAGGNCAKYDGTPCGSFKHNLGELFANLRGLNNAVLSLNSKSSLNIQIQDPGIGNIIDKIPGRILFSLYKVLQTTPILQSGFVDLIEETQQQVNDLSTVLSPVSNTFGARYTVNFLDIPSGREQCELLDDRSDAVSIAAGGLFATGTIAKIFGGLFEAMSKTVFAGPVEMDAGIHGYVHGTIKQNWPHIVGKGFSTIGAVLSSAGSYGFTKIKFCGIMLRELEMLEKQELILTNQASILLGQNRMLCALKNNHPDSCIGFVGNGYGNRGTKKP